MPTQMPQPKNAKTPTPSKHGNLTLLYGLLVAAFLILQSVAWPAGPNVLTRQVEIARATNHSNAATNTPPRPPRTRLSNPLGSGVTFQKLVGRAIKLLMGVSGSLALLMFVYGGFVWTTAGGSPEAIKKGKQIFIWAVIGLLFIFISYALLNALFGALGLS